MVTITTPEAKKLYADSLGADSRRVRVGALNPQSVSQFAAQWQVVGILDASHPFACEISQLAIDFAHTNSIAYLRYERPAIVDSHIVGSNIMSAQNDGVVSVSSISQLLESDILRGQRVLFTIGYRYLSLFSGLRPHSQLFARVLPSEEAISGASAAGFSSAEIMAIRPPVSVELEAALWQQWRITRVVAKASGKPGGEDVKRAIAAQLSIPLILIDRPHISYPHRTISLSEAVEFCIKTLKVYYPNA